MRLVCPFCSSQVNVSDENAGRSVKCPKCGADIPGAPPASSAPTAEEIETVEPARPRALPTRSSDTPESSRDRAEQSSIQERIRRKERDEPDRQKTTNSGVGVILAVLGFFLLTCCGGIGYGVYWVYNKVKETANEAVEGLKPKNDKLTQVNYDKLNEEMTRAEVDALLGKGRPAKVEDLATVFRGEATSEARRQEWTPKVQRNRAVLWQNRDDYLLVAFYPSSETGKVQLKAFAPATGATSQSGIADDDAFARKHVLTRPDGSPGGEAIAISADQLIREYFADQKAADAKYRDKPVEVTGGVLERWDGDAALVYPTGKKGPNRIKVTFAAEMRPQIKDYKPGNAILFRGKCEGRDGTNVVLTRGEFAE